MIELASVQPREDDRVVELLLAGVPEAHRLASWILRDPVGAEDAVQERFSEPGAAGGRSISSWASRTAGSCESW